jgi:hypothetical protein
LGHIKDQKTCSHGSTRKYTEIHGKNKCKKELMATESTEGHGKIKSINPNKAKRINQNLLIWFSGHQIDGWLQGSVRGVVLNLT